ncbi:MAG: T9SS type A sorting domain-containing protein [Lentimicrobium sp.]|nr:T9SS type A sorting domain-containing protein [Lentimicrobium sp.]
MRKLITHLIKVLPLLILMFSTSTVDAQRPFSPLALQDFETTIRNVIPTTESPYRVDFDIFLLDTDPEQDLVLAGYQAGIYINPAIFQPGADVTVSLLTSGPNSNLPINQRPIAIEYEPAINLIKIAGRVPPGPGYPTGPDTYQPSGAIIMTTGLGTKICKVRVVSSLPFTPNSFTNLEFQSSEVLVPLYATRVAHYDYTNATIVYNPDTEEYQWGVPPLNVQLDVVPGDVGEPGTNAHVYENPILNPAAAPTAFNVTGGGSYCEGSAGLPVGLDDSELDVTYELLVDGASLVPAVTAAGTGDAISFGNQLEGVYTVVGTSAGGSTTMTGSAVITEDPLVTSTVTLSASATEVCAGTEVTFTATPTNGGDAPFYTWYVNGASVPTATAATYTYAPANNDQVYVVLTPDQLCTAGDATSDIITMIVNPVSTEEFVVDACDTYTWDLNGETYTVSGDYTFVEGCVTNILHLTITPSSTEEFTEAACDEYTWDVNDVTYTESGDYEYVDGCVTYILHLTITPSGTNEFTVTACDEYFWAVSGETYTVSGDYEFINDCSTNILHLTIIPSSTEEFTEAACDEFTWIINGETYTESGDYQYVEDCVTYILHLTITPSSTEEFAEAACDEYTWDVNDETYTTSGDYEYVEGCVTYILHLTITQSSTMEHMAVACDEYTWDLNGETYTESGDYEYVEGCVTHILQLTITPSSTEEFYVTAVDSYTWDINGETYTVSGDYEYVEGCVTYILHLTITTVPCPDISTWNGSVSSDWFDAANWTPEALPCETTAVTIPGGCPNYPTLLPPTRAVDCYVTINALTINDGGSLIGQQHLCVNSDVVVERSISNSNFHLIGSPVDDVTFGDVFLPQYWFDVWAREYNEATGDWENRFIADHLEVGLGYSVQMAIAPQTATFTGALNTMDVSRTLMNTNPSGDVNRVGWNLLGNPFPSAIDWDVFSSGDYDAQVAVWDEAGAGNYIYWNGTVGSLTDGIIPAQNGFFVKTATDGASLTIPLAAQVHSPMTLYKNAVTNALELRANGNNYYDATYVHFNNYATAGFDSKYDAFKLAGLESAPQLYSIAGYKLSINELPFEGNEIVKVGFTCGVAGTYSVTASGMESFSGSTPILLEDVKLNIFQDLRQNPVYSFNYQPGDNENRFNLHFKSSTGLVDGPNMGISVYSHDHTVVITNTTGLSGDVRIFDLAGRELLNTNIGSSTTTRIPMQVSLGTYVVKVITASGTVNQKVFIH